MIVSVVVPCHNQEEIVKANINLLKNQSIVPDNIIVVNDHSTEFTIVSNDIVTVVDTKVQGRSSTRNLGIKVALDMGSDVIIFMDGDTVPENDLFIENYLGMFPEEHTWGKFVFGTRKHAKRPEVDRCDEYLKAYHGECDAFTSLDRYPSDLLTANMDLIISDGPVEFDDLDHRDLRIVAGIPNGFNQLSMDEKIDHILTGMVTWSCNFALNRVGLDQLRAHNLMVHGREFWFDDNDFNSGWGYEDVALGLDALFSGVDIFMTTKSDIIHYIHGRSDELFTHVEGRHKIMDRYRKLYKNQIMNAIREI